MVKRAANAKKKPADVVSVRMYNVGFGDAFLVRFPDGERGRTMLVDCGAHSAGPGPRVMAQTVDQIIADVSDEEGNARIDVVVATHRHQDHVSGFRNKRWAEVEVGEVWMPWTEDPTDPEAKRIRELQSKTALRLMSMAAAGSASAHLAENALTNAAAMETLHRGFAGKPKRRFLPKPSRAKATFTTTQLPGIIVHAMGPSRDPRVIRDMDPPEGEAYLRAARVAAAGAKGGAPFAESWTYPADQLPAHVVPLPSDWLQKLATLGATDELAVATSLEKAVNGTSLVLMLEVGEACLLFPGDAQWGSWTKIAADPQWAELLARTSFYKVGHHGSHNATVPEVVEMLAHRFVGMVSTREGTRDWDIPRGPLLDALRKKSPVARSDVADVPDRRGKFKRESANHYVDVDVPI